MVKKTARASILESKGRHPLLKNGSIHYAIWQYVKQFPGADAGQIQKATDCNHQRIYDLTASGLIEGVGPTGKRKYYVVEGAETGSRNDRIRVQLSVFINDYDEYSIDVKLIGEIEGAHENNPVRILTKNLEVVVPKRDSKQAKQEAAVQTSARPQPTFDKEIHAPLTVEGEYTIIE